MTSNSNRAFAVTPNAAWGDPGDTNSTAAGTPAAAAGSAASGSGGVSAPGGGAAPAVSGSTSIAGAMHAAANAAGLTGASAAGTPGVAAQPGSGVGQPAPGAIAQPATFDSVLAAHPTLAGEFAAMRQSMEQMQPWVRWAQEQYRNQRQAANSQGQTASGQPAATPAQPANPFGIPQFDRSVLKTFTRDAQGNLVPGPFTPPGAAFEMQRWQEARVEALEGFLDDPMKYLAPLFSKIVEEQAPKAAQGQIATVQNTAFANNYVAENSPWLFVAGPNGQPQRDAFNRPVLSEHGKLFAQTCEQLDGMGVKDVRAQQAIAEKLVFGQAAIARVTAGQTAATAHQQQNGNLLSGAAAALANGTGTTPPNVQPQPQPIVPQAPPGGADNGYGGQRKVRNRMLDAARGAGLQLDALAG